MFWKIQDICYLMGTEIFKLEEEMTEKMKPEFSKTPPAFAFWMSLKVVMAIFPRNDIFFWDTLYVLKENHDLVQYLMREVKDEKYPDSLNAAH